MFKLISRRNEPCRKISPFAGRNKAARQAPHINARAPCDHTFGKRLHRHFERKDAYGMALAAVASGADGVMVEVHNDPMHAWCDGAQSLKPEQFAELAQKMRVVREAVAQ